MAKKKFARRDKFSFQDIAMHQSDYRPGDIAMGLIRGLKSSWEDYPAGTRLLDLGSHTTKWSDSYPTFELPEPVTHYYAGIGEGEQFDSFEQALLVSLYDQYQTNDNLEDGDTLEAEFQGKTYRFKCVGVHVMPA